MPVAISVAVRPVRGYTVAMASSTLRNHRVAVFVWLAALAIGCASFEGARLYQSGTEALDRGDATLAIAQLERAAQLVPEASEIQNHLGLAYQAAGRRQDAESAFQRAVDLDCTNDAAVENLRVVQAYRHSRVQP